MKDKNQNSFFSVLKSTGRMFTRLIMPQRFTDDGTNVLEEEMMMTPFRTVMRNLLQNKLAIIGAVLFLFVLLFNIIGSRVVPFDPLYTELTNSNLRPSRNYLKMPKELANKDIVKIVSGVSFSVALTSDGNLTVWGTECNLWMNNVSEPILRIPQEIQDANIVDLAAGSRFVNCVDDQGKFYGWGVYAQGQARMPEDIAEKFEEENIKVSKLAGGTQWAAVLGDDGNLYVWGSQHARDMYLVPRDTQGRIVDFAVGASNMALILDDGTLEVIGARGTEYIEQAPALLTDGSRRVAEVVSTNHNVLARDEYGDLYLWGSTMEGLHKMPEELNQEKAVDIAAGLKNFVVVDDDGEVFIWGANERSQLEVPRNLKGVTKVYADCLQFYAADDGGKIVGSWGNKGYIFGSDNFGRDVFTRVIHGGTVSLLVGAIAVVIWITIAIIVGLSAGFFGGWVDMGLMRLADIVSSLPFLPIAVTLSYVIGFSMPADQRMYLIMVIIGVLSWPPLARLLRAQLLLEREKDFVLAARSLGIKQRSIMGKHILPNVFSLVLVDITLGYASCILTEAGLSFLGFGVQEPTPSWGNMLTGAQDSMVISFYWWRWIIPALFVFAAALSINMIGDALRDAMDPKANER